MDGTPLHYYQEIKPMAAGFVLSTDRLCYRWQENAIRIPDTASSRTNGRTHAVAVSVTGQLIIFHQANPAVLIYSADGVLQDAWGDRFPGAHGMTLVQEGDTEFLWLTDNRIGLVVKATLEGRIVSTLHRPPLALYTTNGYAPTWVAVHEERNGGSGNIWVADGDGSSLIHTYDKAGSYLGSLTGAEGAAGLFHNPHSIFIDTRKEEAELYIADHGNHQIQVYDTEGNYKRAFGADFLTSPCAFGISGRQLIIPELRARVTVLDEDDQLIGYLGNNARICDIQGWPNHPPHRVEARKFYSPHAVTADALGNLYVVESVIGGRTVKLERLFCK